MHEIYEKYRIRGEEGKYLKIMADSDPESPREWDGNLSHFLMVHGRYNFVDELPENNEFNSFKELSNACSNWDEVEETLYKLFPDIVELKPVYMLDHSIQVLSMKRFGGMYGHWDSGQIGYIMIRKSDMKDVVGITAEKIIEDEFQIYTEYFEGNVYGFELYEEKYCNMGYLHDNILDSCWGFYGTNWKKNGLLEMAGIDEEDLEEVIE